MTEDLNIKNDALAKVFSESRKKWTIKIKNCADNIKDITNIPSVQPLVISYRAMFVENIAIIATRLKRLWAEYYREHRSKFFTYSEPGNKVSDKYKDNIIKGDLADQLIVIGTLEAQLDFYKDGIRTLDNLIWAIKNRIAVENI